MTEQEKYFAWKNTEHLWEIRLSWLVIMLVVVCMVVSGVKILVFNDDWQYFKKQAEKHKKGCNK